MIIEWRNHFFTADSEVIKSKMLNCLQFGGPPPGRAFGRGTARRANEPGPNAQGPAAPNARADAEQNAPPGAPRPADPNDPQAGANEANRAAPAAGEHAAGERAAGERAAGEHNGEDPAAVGVPGDQPALAVVLLHVLRELQLQRENRERQEEDDKKRKKNKKNNKKKGWKGPKGGKWGGGGPGGRFPPPGGRGYLLL